jgi:hypothetical protein
MGPRIYPSYQNISQLLPTPTSGPGPTPTIAPTSTPTPTPTPTPGVPIITTGLTTYLDGQSLSYPGSGSVWYSISPATNDFILQGSPEFNYSTLKNYFSFNGLSQTTYNTTGVDPYFFGKTFTFGGWFRASVGPVQKSFLAHGPRGVGKINDEFLGQSLNLYKDENDYLVLNVWQQIDVTPTQNEILTGATITSTIKLPNDQWSYIIARYIPNSQIDVFLNGVNVATGVAPSQGNLIRPGNGPTNVAWNLCIGSPKVTRMDVGDVEIYNASLSDVQILSNYNAQSYKYI